MINHIRVQSLKKEHLSQVSEIEALCFAEPWSETALKLLLEADGLGMVAVNEMGQVLGYGGMMTVLDEGQITNIAVHPDARRCGIGKQILLALLAEACERKLNLLSLEVRVSNLPAQGLYLQCGFTIEGIRKHFYRHPTEDGLVMIWKRTSNSDAT